MSKGWYKKKQYSIYVLLLLLMVLSALAPLGTLAHKRDIQQITEITILNKQKEVIGSLKIVYGVKIDTIECYKNSRWQTCDGILRYINMSAQGLKFKIKSSGKIVYNNATFHVGASLECNPGKPAYTSYLLWILKEPASAAWEALKNSIHKSNVVCDVWIIVDGKEMYVGNFKVYDRGSTQKSYGVIVTDIIRTITEYKRETVTVTVVQEWSERSLLLMCMIVLLASIISFYMGKSKRA